MAMAAPQRQHHGHVYVQRPFEHIRDARDRFTRLLGEFDSSLVELYRLKANLGDPQSQWVQEIIDEIVITESRLMVCRHKMEEQFAQVQLDASNAQRARDRVAQAGRRRRKANAGRPEPEPALITLADGEVV